MVLVGLSYSVFLNLGLKTSKHILGILNLSASYLPYSLPKDVCSLSLTKKLDSNCF
jgi:hypothetical protein